MSSSAPPPAILVVDDNSQNRALVEATLEDEGFRVVLADGGGAALAAFDREPIDCVLLDVRMPGMSGFEVCRELRARPRGATIPVVFLTALRDVETFDQARAAGGDDFLTKPLRPPELLVRVRAALELKRLGAENRAYYATIREQRDAVMRLQLQKEQLTAFLVHDLRNPVNALDLQAQLLLRDKSISDKARESATAIRQEARRLTQMITNMLDLSRGEGGELTIIQAPVDLTVMVDELVGEFTVRAKQQHVRIETAVAVGSVVGDASILRRLLENLIDNALRYAPKGSVITVSVSRCEAGTELRVADQGEGIPESMREAVFERYVQGERSGAQRSGYGLGLAFCKLAALAHGGSIAIEDAGPGAAFCVRLPDGGDA